MHLTFHWMSRLPVAPLLCSSSSELVFFAVIFLMSKPIYSLICCSFISLGLFVQPDSLASLLTLLSDVSCAHFESFFFCGKVTAKRESGNRQNYKSCLRPCEQIKENELKLCSLSLSLFFDFELSVNCWNYNLMSFLLNNCFFFSTCFGQ